MGDLNCWREVSKPCNTKAVIHEHLTISVYKESRSFIASDSPGLGPEGAAGLSRADHGSYRCSTKTADVSDSQQTFAFYGFIVGGGGGHGLVITGLPIALRVEINIRSTRLEAPTFAQHVVSSSTLDVNCDMEHRQPHGVQFDLERVTFTAALSVNFRAIDGMQGTVDRRGANRNMGVRPGVNPGPKSSHCPHPARWLAPRSNYTKLGNDPAWRRNIG
ncbi:hypothetical protein B0H13DRAFT_1890310 [Mycena leptocephala]|nr:hypothetical protein B0H13DRAFT_1890310 [Mycena leptocephala]